MNFKNNNKKFSVFYWKEKYLEKLKSNILTVRISLKLNWENFMYKNKWNFLNYLKSNKHNIKYRQTTTVIFNNNYIFYYFRYLYQSKKT